MTPAYQAALKAASRGMFVFPVQPGDKTPISTPSGRFRWGQGCTTDAATIRDWFENKCPAANYGIAAKPSRLIIVDCDMPKEGKQIPPAFREPGVNDGLDVLACILADVDADFPFDTLAVATPSGGVHFYFSNPRDLQMRNTSIVPGWIDVRANGGDDGGFVVGPGSVRADGKPYAVVQSNPIREAPPWVLALCAPPAAPEALTPTPGAPRWNGPAKFDGLVETLASKGEGERNETLNWAANRMFKDGAPITEAQDILGPVALRIGLPQGEIDATIRSAYRSKGR